MVELGASPGVGAVAALLVLSLLAFVGGTVFRKWPDRVQAYTEDFDGLAWLVTQETYRALIVHCGLTLTALSFAALVAAAWLT
jgi:hypothetical protein